ncbi:hypothetical protein SDC9_90803 [bioreactor metagenome]|uniref:HTH cro/C1-type domain-containing protein n=1 Tax=bioreactor metagenome TaxID=1076179 RepID=A0A644ZTB0_9ZZZZ
MTELAILRIRQGVTQKEMAGKIGIHVATLSIIERKRYVANPEQRARIVKAYGINEAEFFDRETGLAK